MSEHNEFRGPVYEAAKQLAREQFGALAAKGLDEQRRAEPAPAHLTPLEGVRKVLDHCGAEGLDFPDKIDMTGAYPGVIEYVRRGGQYDAHWDASRTIQQMERDVDAERQRANRLSDELGAAIHFTLKEEQNSNARLRYRVADLESECKSKDRQIAALKAKLLVAGVK